MLICNKSIKKRVFRFEAIILFVLTVDIDMLTKDKYEL